MWWDDIRKTITFAELTVSFETSFTGAVQRKEGKYCDLVMEAEKAGYKADLLTIEVGARGLLHMPGFKKLKNSLGIDKKNFNKLLLDSSREAMIASHKIWCARNRFT